MNKSTRYCFSERAARREIERQLSTLSGTGTGTDTDASRSDMERVVSTEDGVRRRKSSRRHRQSTLSQSLSMSTSVAEPISEPAPEMQMDRLIEEEIAEVGSVCLKYYTDYIIYY